MFRTFYSIQNRLSTGFVDQTFLPFFRKNDAKISSPRIRASVFFKKIAFIFVIPAADARKPRSGIKKTGADDAIFLMILGLERAELSGFSSSTMTILSRFIPMACRALTVSKVWLMVPRRLRETISVR